MSKLMPRLSHALRVTNGAQLCRSSGGCAPRCRGAPCVGDGIWRLFSDHIIRLDRYTGVKIEYNQSGYTNSETSPSTPRPETSCNPPLSHTGSSQERAGKTKWQHPSETPNHKTSPTELSEGASERRRFFRRSVRRSDPSDSSHAVDC